MGTRNNDSFAMKRGVRPDFHNATPITTGSIALKWHGARIKGPCAGMFSVPRTVMREMSPMRGKAIPAVRRQPADFSVFVILLLLAESLVRELKVSAEVSKLIDEVLVPASNDADVADGARARRRECRDEVREAAA